MEKSIELTTRIRPVQVRRSPPRVQERDEGWQAEQHKREKAVFLDNVKIALKEAPGMCFKDRRCMKQAQKSPYLLAPTGKGRT